MNFIDEFLKFTSELESPTSYLRWAAISAVAATLRDNVWLATGPSSKLYPNIFVLLIGPPALGKGRSMKIASVILKAMTSNTKIIEGSASMQAVIKTLGTTETGKPKGASAILYAEELSAFFQRDIQNIELLTDLWDYHETYDRTLISWSVRLSNVCLTMLAGSNEILLRQIFNETALFGGLLSRTITVLEHKKRHKKLLVNTDPNSYNAQFLIKHLNALTQVRGPVTFEPDAFTELEKFHESWDEEANRSKSGIEGRLITHIQKVSLILAMSDGEMEKVIRKSHVEQAIDLMMALYRNYQLLSMESGGSQVAQPAAILLRLLATAPNYTLERRGILRKNFGEFDLERLDTTVATLEAADLICVIMNGNEVWYKLTGKALEMYKKILNEGEGK